MRRQREIVTACSKKRRFSRPDKLVHLWAACVLRRYEQDRGGVDGDLEAVSDGQIAGLVIAQLASLSQEIAGSATRFKADQSPVQAHRSTRAPSLVARCGADDGIC